MNAGRHSVHIETSVMNRVQEYGAVCRCIRKACLTSALLGLIAINTVGCASFSFDDPFQSAIDDHDLSERTARYERARPRAQQHPTARGPQNVLLPTLPRALSSLRSLGCLL